MLNNLLVIDVFVSQTGGGNPAGVLPRDNRSKDEMQQIAKDLGFSETVFYEEIESHRYKLSYFTPTCEIDFCGHATIAVASVFELDIINFLTNSGEVKVFKENNTYFIEVGEYVTEEILTDKEIYESLGLEFDEDFIHKPIIVSTGVRDLLIPVKTTDMLNNVIKLNLKQIENLSIKYNVVGYHVYEVENLYNNFLNVRNFAPLYGIDEESATGSSNASLMGLLNQRFNINAKLFIQGEAMNLRSEIYAKVVEDRILVGGNTLTRKKVN